MSLNMKACFWAFARHEHLEQGGDLSSPTPSSSPTTWQNLQSTQTQASEVFGSSQKHGEVFFGFQRAKLP